MGRDLSIEYLPMKSLLLLSRSGQFSFGSVRTVKGRFHLKPNEAYEHSKEPMIESHSYAELF